MAAKKGRLLKVQRDSTGVGGWVDIGHMRSKSYTVANETVDISNETDGVWRQLLEGAGNQSVSVSGSGVWTKGTHEVAMRLAAFNNTHEILRIIDDHGDYITGSFAISSFGNSAEHNAEQAYEISLESAGDVVLTTV